MQMIKGGCHYISLYLVPEAGIEPALREGTRF